MRGDWINFAELCRRVPLKSARTLRRMIAAKAISYRQAKRGGRMQFNWATVERELAVLDTPSLAVRAGRVSPMAGESALEMLTDEVRELIEKVNLLTVLVSEKKEKVA